MVPKLNLRFFYVLEVFLINEHSSYIKRCTGNNRGNALNDLGEYDGNALNDLTSRNIIVLPYSCSHYACFFFVFV